MLRKTKMVGAVLVGITVVVLIAGCLKVRLGDPEASKVDPGLVGNWIVMGDAGAEKGEMASVAAYDGRTYLVTYMVFKREADKVTRDGMMLYKMWLTDVGGVTFATLEPTGPGAVGVKPEEMEWAVMRVTRDGETLRVRTVNREFVEGRGVKTPEDLKKLIAENVSKDDLYDKDAGTFERLSGDRETEAKGVLEAFGLGK